VTEPSRAAGWVLEKRGACCSVGRCDRVDFGEGVGLEGDVRGLEVLVEVGGGSGPGDRDDVVALVQEPGEGELRGGDVEVCGELAKWGVAVAVGGEVLGSPLRNVAPGDK
jgi:hypothetical protein